MSCKTVARAIKGSWVGPPAPFLSTSLSPAYPLPPPAETIKQRLKSQEMSNSLPLEFINCPHPSQGNLALFSDKRRAPGSRRPPPRSGKPLEPAWASPENGPVASTQLRAVWQPSSGQLGVYCTSQLPHAFVWHWEEVGIWGATVKSGN